MKQSNKTKQASILKNKPWSENRNRAGSLVRFHPVRFGMCQKDMCSVFTAEEMTSQGSPSQRSAKEFGLHVFMALLFLQKLLNKRVT